MSCSHTSFCFVFARCCLAALSPCLSEIVYVVPSKVVSISCFKFVKSLLYFVVLVVESSLKVVYIRSDQSSSGGLDDLNGLLCAQRGLNSKSFRNKAEILRKP